MRFYFTFISTDHRCKCMNYTRDGKTSATCENWNESEHKWCYLDGDSEKIKTCPGAELETATNKYWTKDSFFCSSKNIYYFYIKKDVECR